MTIYPSVLTLESKLYEYLSSQVEIIELADITPIHPSSDAELAEGKARIVISQIADPQEGNIISRAVLQPIVQFAFYGTSHHQVQSLLEVTVEVLEHFPTVDLQSDDQRVTTLYRTGSLPIDFDSQAQLFVCAVTYQFFLTKRS